MTAAGDVEVILGRDVPHDGSRCVDAGRKAQKIGKQCHAVVPLRPFKDLQCRGGFSEDDVTSGRGRCPREARLSYPQVSKAPLGDLVARVNRDAALSLSRDFERRCGRHPRSLIAC